MNTTAMNPAQPGAMPSKPAPREIRQMSLRDIIEALRLGFDDVQHCRTDALLIAAILPVAGLLFAGVFVVQGFLPFVFPLLAGFALLGPLATLWFVALSRQRERGDESVSGVFTSSKLKAIQRLSVITVAVYLCWNLSATLIYYLTLGSSTENAGQFFFVRVFTTSAGWEMLFIGCIVGAAFALLTLAINSISFALVVDRDVTATQAISVSFHAMARNPLFVLVWGAVVAAGLILGTLPCLLGFVVVLPLLGHTSWHVYRKMVV